METVSRFQLRVPPSIMNEVQEFASREDTSVNQFILVAVTEKLAALRTQEHFAARRARAVPDDLLAILSRTGTEPPREGDEIPDGWIGEDREGCSSGTP